MKSDSEETEETISQIDDTIYPMYLPSGTYLSSEEEVSKEDGERVILTFSGETPFIMVQETVNLDKEVMSVNGDPEFITDTVGAISDNSIEFISNGHMEKKETDKATAEFSFQCKVKRKLIWQSQLSL